jgi:TolA-binding protein
MLRFLLPALLMVGALVALFAGALGDWQGLSDSWDRLHTVVANLAPDRPAVPAAPAPSSPPAAVSQAPPASNGDAQQTAADTLRKQVAGLQAQVAQRTQELASLHTDTDQARQELETLRLQQQMQAALNARHQDQIRQAETRARRQHRNPVPAPPAFASAQPGLVVPPLTQLMAAREVLASGRPQDARNLLATAETQMVFQPVTPDQPDTMGGNRAATAVREAIHLVDTGDIDQAIQALNRAIDITKSQNQGAGNAAPMPTAVMPSGPIAPGPIPPVSMPSGLTSAAPPYPPPAGYRFANQP